MPLPTRTLRLVSLAAGGALLLLAVLLAALPVGHGPALGLPARAGLIEGREASFAGRPLTVGVPWLPPPDGPDSRIYMEEGFEIALAAELAGTLSAELRLVRVEPGAAPAALDEGRVDLVIVRAGADDPLRARALAVDSGFASGLGVAMRTDRPLPSWAALKGRVVCVSEANGAGQRLAARLGAQVKLARAPAVALMHMRVGECDAALHDRALLDPLLDKRSWQKFSATLPAVEPTALVVAAARERPDVARAVQHALVDLGTAERWQQRREKWASTVSFEVYRDQVAADCH
ncbi:transporter substrate-binding domain-containing protein [Xanthobacter sediminis]